MEQRTGREAAAIHSARSAGDAAARTETLAWLARAGLVARGAVYGIVGLLAAKLAIGSGGRTTNQAGALQTIAEQPFGKALLLAVAVGLAGYAAWRLLRAAVGHGREERDSGFQRVASLASGIAYAALCFTAVQILLGSRSGSSGSPGKAAAGVLGWPAGPVLVGAAGVILIGVGTYQGYKGAARKFLETSDTTRMSPAVKRGFTAVGLFGHLARMVVFGLIGYGLLRAAIDFDPSKAVGLDGSLNELASSSEGPLLLGLAAFGLIGFGVYSIVDSRYRRV